MNGCWALYSNGHTHKTFILFVLGAMVPFWMSVEWHSFGPRQHCAYAFDKWACIYLHQFPIDWAIHGGARTVESCHFVEIKSIVVDKVTFTVSPFLVRIDDYYQKNSHSSSVSISSSAVATLDSGRPIILRARQISRVWMAKGFQCNIIGKTVPTLPEASEFLRRLSKSYWSG